MHAALFMEHTNKLRSASLPLLTQKPLKERAGCIATILLLYDSGQLFVVAYQDEAVNILRQYAYDIGLQELRCLVDDTEGKVFQRKDERTRL
jgi:hypothetical protein